MAFALGPRARAQNYRLEAFDSIGSTNAEALERARAGERGPLWLVTDQQTAGRGRRQRAWISPRGNLAATIVETIDVQPSVAATLGFAAGLARTRRPWVMGASTTWRQPRAMPSPAMAACSTRA